MITVAPIITDNGKSLLLRSIGGEIITFTRFKIGSGELPTGSRGEELTDLINPMLDFPITNVDISGTNVSVNGKFDSSQISENFKWSEIGIFCVGEETQAFNGDGESVSFAITSSPLKLHKVVVDGEIAEIEGYNSATGIFTLTSAPSAGVGNIVAYFTSSDEKLYGYSNDTLNSGYLVQEMTGVVSEQIVTFIIAADSTENITAVLSEALIYATKDEFNNHSSSQNNPHKVTKEQVGLGNVPNVTTNDQTPTYFTIDNYLANLTPGEKLSSAFVKIEGAIRALIKHITNSFNNPHRVTAEQAGAAASVHKHSTADITSGVLPPVRGGTGTNSIQALASILPAYGLARIWTGQYTGTGEIGQDNAISLSLPFPANFIFVCPYYAERGNVHTLTCVRGTEVTSIGNHMKWLGNTVEWYSLTSPEEMLNVQGQIYLYFAII